MCIKETDNYAKFQTDLLSVFLKLIYTYRHDIYCNVAKVYY